MKYKMLKFGAAPALVFGLCLIVPGPMHPVAPAYAASCSSLSIEFKRRGKPRFLRVINRNRSLANYYNSTLKRVRSGSVPTRGEMKTAYNRTRSSCSSGKCRSDARAIYNAALKLHSYNRRWARAGCPGTLSS